MVLVNVWSFTVSAQRDPCIRCCTPPVQAESLEAERVDLLQKVEGYEEARQVGTEVNVSLC